MKEQKWCDTEVLEPWDSMRFWGTYIKYICWWSNIVDFDYLQTERWISSWNNHYFFIYLHINKSFKFFRLSIFLSFVVLFFLLFVYNDGNVIDGYLETSLLYSLRLMNMGNYINEYTITIFTYILYENNVHIL